jgi:hypothetical protein
MRGKRGVPMRVCPLLQRLAEPVEHCYHARGKVRCHVPFLSDRLRPTGRRYSDGNAADLYWSFGQMIAYASRGTRVQSWRRRRVQTTCGTLTVRRPWHVCRPCGHGFSPADITLAVSAHQRLSDGVQGYLTRLGATTSFREATATLEALTAIHVAPETVRHHTQAAGAVLEAQTQQAIATVTAGQDLPSPAPAPGMLVVETDGVMVRYRDGWHEVKIGVVGGQVAGALVVPSYVGARAGPEHFGPRLVAEAARRGALDIVGWDGPLAGRGLARLRPVVVLGDGAAWIWNLAGEHFGEAIEIVDYYHATEHVWTVARAVFGDGTAEATAWASQQTGTLLAQGGASVRAALATLTPQTGAAREVVRRERAYFTTHTARMEYPTFRAAGLPIGSGAIESGAKHLVQLRLKRSGCRWSLEGAHRVLAVRLSFLAAA